MPGLMYTRFSRPDLECAGPGSPWTETSGTGLILARTTSDFDQKVTAITTPGQEFEYLGLMDLKRKTALLAVVKTQARDRYSDIIVREMSPRDIRNTGSAALNLILTATTDEVKEQLHHDTEAIIASERVMPGLEIVVRHVEVYANN